ncbi:MAG: sulfate reduction electron transfer complex DsrMKJOP subunit DsrM [Candidatus Binataceae bacterium]
MKALYALIAVGVMAAVAFHASDYNALRITFGIVLPYAAFATFLAGFTYKVVRWAWSPVPFHIPTTCGQQKSLSWIKPARLENPSTTLGVVARMALEVLLFRSLFRNTRAELREGPHMIYAENKFLWLAALAFHWSLLIIIIRHIRFFILPIPPVLYALDAFDGFFQVAEPTLYVTDLVVLASLLYLLGRRLWDPQIRYFSLPADYFALFLLLGLAISGIVMRYFAKVDLVAVKQLALGLVSFSPVVPQGVAPLFFVHLTLLSALAAYFPFSKLMHMGGIFLSPTRNLANNSRTKRHVNPWNYPVPVHTYQEWEDEFREKIRAAGLPLERE